MGNIETRLVCRLLRRSIWHHGTILNLFEDLWKQTNLGWLTDTPDACKGESIYKLFTCNLKLDFRAGWRFDELVVPSRIRITLNEIFFLDKLLYNLSRFSNVTVIFFHFLPLVFVFIWRRTIEDWINICKVIEHFFIYNWLRHQVGLRGLLMRVPFMVAWSLSITDTLLNSRFFNTSSFLSWTSHAIA